MTDTTQRSWGRIPEGAFLGLLGLLCLVLLVIQYRWTGELSRAEGVRLRASLSERLQALGWAFDTELRESYTELLPAADDIDPKGREAAHASRLEAWKAAQHRPCFARLAVAVPENNGLNLLTMDLASGRLTTNPWPADWARLKDRLESVRLGGAPTVPIADPRSAILEFPVFGGSAPGGRRGREREWLLLELDMDYVRNVWMPELVRTHLNPGPEPLFDLEVRQTATTNALIYDSHPNTVKGAEIHPAGSKTMPRFRIHALEPHRYARPRGPAVSEFGQPTHRQDPTALQSRFGLGKRLSQAGE